MNIIGLSALVFGVEDLAGATQYLMDYGLKDAGNGRFEALDGTAVVVGAKDDSALPAALPTGAMIRKTIYDVADQAALDQISDELGKDREVKTLADGSIESHDDDGFCLGFQVSTRRKITASREAVNCPGFPVARPANELGIVLGEEYIAKPRSLSHVVYFVPDKVKSEAFYADRLGFVTTDIFAQAGPFMRPAGTQEHHTLFLIETPPFMQGVEHFTFHMAGPGDLLRAGRQFEEKGYQTFWGPGRHYLGSNYFWYFKSPFGCNVEYDADMDLHDDNWKPRVADLSMDNSQAFLFSNREKWMPGPDSGAHQDDIPQHK